MGEWMFAVETHNLTDYPAPPHIHPLPTHKHTHSFAIAFISFSLCLALPPYHISRLSPYIAHCLFSTHIGIRGRHRPFRGSAAPI